MNGFWPSAREWRQVIRYGVILAILGFGVLHARALFTGVFPFALAFALSYLLDPVVAALATRLRVGRGWSTLFVLLLLLTAGGFFLTWATTVLIEQVGHFLDVFPQYRQTVAQFITEWTDRLTTLYGNLPPDLAAVIADNTSRLGDTVEQILSGAGKTFLGLLKTLPGLLSFTLLIPIATFFISKDLPKIRRFLWSLIPTDERSRVRDVILDLLQVAWRYLRAQAILIFLTTLFTTVGLLLIGIENWFAAGILIGLLDILPVLGPIAAFAPWAGYLLIVGNTGLAFSLLIVYAIAGSVRSLFEAKVVGDSVGLHPAATLFAMYTGALLWGIKGAVLGPVLLIVGKAIVKAWRAVST